MAKVISITRGDDEDLELEVVNSAGQPEPIDNSTIYITMKLKATDADDNAKLTHDVVAPSTPETQGGKIVIRLPSTKTALLPVATLFMDIQIQFSDGTIKTVYNDKVEVVADITRRVEAI